MIAALFVEARGAYAGLLDVDPWDIRRDARLYAGPHPVVAHPPCQRWGRYWQGGPSRTKDLLKGDDGGCFIAALEAVRRWGGVLEHPAGSAAWRAFGLIEPPRAGGWVVADWRGGWTCCVDQGHYGHIAQKATWLYAVAPVLPSLAWGRSPRAFTLDDQLTAAERRVIIRRGRLERLSKRQRAATPIEFRGALIRIAESCKTAQIQEIDPCRAVTPCPRSPATSTP